MMAFVQKRVERRQKNGSRGPDSALRLDILDLYYRISCIQNFNFISQRIEKVVAFDLFMSDCVEGKRSFSSAEIVDKHAFSQMLDFFVAKGQLLRQR